MFTRPWLHYKYDDIYYDMTNVWNTLVKSTSRTSNAPKNCIQKYPCWWRRWHNVFLFCRPCNITITRQSIAIDGSHILLWKHVENERNLIHRQFDQNGWWCNLRLMLIGQAVQESSAELTNSKEIQKQWHCCWRSCHISLVFCEVGSIGNLH